VNISVEESTAIPARLRPTPAQVCNWYEHSLRGMGADVRRVTPERLEFALNFSRSFLDTNLGTTLATIAEGEVDVSATSDGFEVSVRATPRAWVSYLPVVLFAATTGGVAFLATSVRFLPALVAAGLLGVTWMRTRFALSRFLITTNETLADSFASAPPGGGDLSSRENAR
jgi:hypothetical protein